MMFLPKLSSCLRLPLRKPSPTPASNSSEPTPQAIPNMVRNERSLCAQSVRTVWEKVSSSMRIMSPPVGGRAGFSVWLFDCWKRRGLAELVSRPRDTCNNEVSSENYDPYFVSDFGVGRESQRRLPRGLGGARGKSATLKRRSVQPWEGLRSSFVSSFHWICRSIP